MLNRREIYNCSYVNRHVPIYRLMEHIGYFPIKKRGNVFLYHSPLRIDKNPSFYLNVITNTYKDFGDTTQTKDNLNFTLIDLVSRLYGISVKEALNRIQTFSFSPYQPSFEERESMMELKEVKALSHPALLNYLRNERCIDLSIAKKYCVEVHYLNANRAFFAIGFKNASGGFELRNSIDKRTYKPKDISYIKEVSFFDKIAVYEGFIDFLSSFSNSFHPINSDYLILNGVGMTYKAKEILIQYKEVLSFLDNDDGGSTGTSILMGMGLSLCKDMRDHYKDHKDVNAYLAYSINKQKNIKQEPDQTQHALTQKNLHRKGGLSL